MKLNRKLVLILSLVLSLALATGGTLAYLSDSDADVNVMTLGSVYIVQNEQERDENGDLIPFQSGVHAAYPAVGEIEWAEEGVMVNGNEYKVFDAGLKNVIDKIVTVTNTGKSPAYVRTIIAIEAPNNDPKSLIHVNINGDDGLTWDEGFMVKIGEDDYYCMIVTYEDALAPKETSAPSLMQLFLGSEAGNEDVAAFGDTWEVLVLSQAVQTEGFENAADALNAGFGVLDADSVALLFDGWDKWEEGKEIGSPNGTLPGGNATNNPPVTYTGDPEELVEMLTAAGAAGSGDVTITLTESYDMTGVDWTPVYVDGYHGAGVVTIEGNGNTIKGLTAPLFAGGFAGKSGIVIKDLTIADSDIVSDNGLGVGAFIESADSMYVITLDNCHVVNCTISTTAAESRIGGLIGWVTGYAKENDGPVKTYVTITNCSVVNTEIETFGSVGGLIGHAGASDYTWVTIEDCTVTGCELTSTDDGGWRVGVAVGTANNGHVVINNITESGNTLAQTGKTAPVGQSNLYGRFVPAGTGTLEIDGTPIN